MREPSCFRALAAVGLGSPFYLMTADRERAVYCLYLEDGTLSTTTRDALARNIDQQLATINMEYRAKRDSGRLAPLEVQFSDRSVVDAIDWIDAAGDYMCVHADGDTFVLRGTMKHLEDVLDPATFVRVHRSAIVNRHRVTAMRAHRNGEYFLKLGDNVELKLSRKYKGNLARLANPV